MQPQPTTIDSIDLEQVRGGFGAILGSLLQAAPGIMQGVSGIISASKAGKGGGAAPGGESAAAAQAAAAPAGRPPQRGSGCERRL